MAEHYHDRYRPSHAEPPSSRGASRRGFPGFQRQALRGYQSFCVPRPLIEFLSVKEGSALATLAVPLRLPVFRAMWGANIVSNAGTLMQSVGAAWLMTSLTSSTTLVGLVQTAATLPVFLMLLMMVSRSNGLSVRISITSTLASFSSSFHSDAADSF